MPSTTYRPLTGRFSNMTHWDGANCLTVGKRHLSQREAAIEAVRAIGLNQNRNIEEKTLHKYEMIKKMFLRRMKIVTKL